MKARATLETIRQRPPNARSDAHGGPSLSAREEFTSLSPHEDLTSEPSTPEPSPTEAAASTLGSLPLGARLILRCRADWRAAVVSAFEIELGRVVLSVASPKGGTYRVRRPADAALSHDGHIPVLGEGHWRVGLARYDVRW